MKSFLFIGFLLFSLVTYAQRAAVLEFKAGVGISQGDVDGISAIFITYFRPSGYTMVERTQIDRVIDEQGFQRGNLTEQQMVRIGEILNVSKVVVGDINVVMGQYNVDVRALNVESGTIAATEGETFSGTSYRESMKSIAQKLATQIAVGVGPVVSASTTQSSINTSPITLYGYLTVFPNNLGKFEAIPYKIIDQINKNVQYGYGTWRLPTLEELALLRSNNLIDYGNYITSDGNKQGIVRLVTDKKKGVIAPIGYVDLGLPSGTLWKENDEDVYVYHEEEAIRRYGYNLPSKEQCEELITICSWFSHDGRNVFIKGPNGKMIRMVLTRQDKVGEPWQIYISPGYIFYVKCLKYNKNVIAGVVGNNGKSDREFSVHLVTTK